MTKADYTIAAGILEVPSGDTIRVNSPQWWEWLESDEAVAFTFDCDHGIKNYRARKEAIKGKSGKFWYAYKRHEGTLRKRYIGKSEELSLEKLEAIAYDLLTPAKSRESKPELPTELPNEVGEYRELLNEARRIAIQRESDFERLIAQKVEVCKENQELKQQLELLHTRLGNTETELKKANALVMELEKQIEKERKQFTDARYAYAAERRQLSERLQSEKAKIEAPDTLLAELLNEYEQNHDEITASLPKLPKEVTRNWVELWRFKTWLKARNQEGGSSQ
jgi:chromosome segregation ATPase